MTTTNNDSTAVIAADETARIAAEKSVIERAAKALDLHIDEYFVTAYALQTVKHQMARDYINKLQDENARLLETVDTICALLQTLPIGGNYTTEQHATVGKAYDLAGLTGRTVSRPIESKNPPTANG